MDEKVYQNQTIEDAPFPAQPDLTTATQTDSPSTSNPTSIAGASTIPQQDFPTLQVAQELLSTAINTRTKKIIQEFQFTPSGAIQIGNFESGVSGDVRISPEGITARNMLGDTTFVIDSETGDAIFSGTIQTGTLIAGIVRVGASGNIVIDGNNERIVIYDVNGIARVVLGFLKGAF